MVSIKIMTRVRDYHRKNYKNPFFRKFKSGFATRGRGFYYGRGPSKRKNFRQIVVLIFFLAAVGGWFYFLFYSPYFEVKKVEIFGLEKISETEIKELIQSQMTNHKFLIFQQKNIFWFDNKFAEKNINSKYAIVALKINKILPDSIKVELHEKRPVLIWKNGEKFYHVDQDGIIIHELSIDEITALQNDDVNLAMPIVYDTNNNEQINVKDAILDAFFVQAIIDFNKLIKEKTSLIINNFEVIDKQDQIGVIKAIVSDGWAIYFYGNKDINLQVEKLSIFLREKGENEIKALEYIDLRFTDRIYYK